MDAAAAWLRGPGTTDLTGVGPIVFVGIRLAFRVAGWAEVSGSVRAAWAATATFSRWMPPRKITNAMNADGAASKMRRFVSSAYVFQNCHSPIRISAQPATSRLQ